MLPYIGEILALTTAIVWALAVILFKKSGETVHPLALNAFKTTLGMVLLIPTIALAGESLFHSAPLYDYVLLLFSGAIGIAVADSLFFKSLNLLGAGLSAIVDCLYSPFIILLSVVFIQEQLGGLQILGVLLILSAVWTVTHQRETGPIKRQDLLLGSLYGGLAMALMAASIVTVKPLLDRSPVLWFTEMRMIGGCLLLYVISLCHPRRKQILGSLTSLRSWRYILPGSFLGAYIAVVLWVGGMKYTQASTAAALNQSSNVFIFIFAAIFLKEKITPLRALAILVAITGVFFVTFG